MSKKLNFEEELSTMALFGALDSVETYGHRGRNETAEPDAVAALSELSHEDQNTICKMVQGAKLYRGLSSESRDTGLEDPGGAGATARSARRSREHWRTFDAT